VKRQTNSKSILLKKYGETTDQSVSTCPILAEEQYIERYYNSLSAELHFNISKRKGVSLENEN